jgi:hypothetical protein
VAHACKPSYSGGRDQEDHNLKPAPTNSSQDPISKEKSSCKRTGGVTQGIGPELKSQNHKQRERERGIGGERETFKWLKRNYHQPFLNSSKN